MWCKTKSNIILRVKLQLWKQMVTYFTIANTNIRYIILNQKELHVLSSFRYFGNLMCLASGTFISRLSSVYYGNFFSYMHFPITKIGLVLALAIFRKKLILVIYRKLLPS